MDYDALAKMFASEQDPRQITITDALQKPERDRKIQMLLEEARAQQQFENQRNLTNDAISNKYKQAQVEHMMNLEKQDMSMKASTGAAKMAQDAKNAALLNDYSQLRNVKSLLPINEFRAITKFNEALPSLSKETRSKFMNPDGTFAMSPEQLDDTIDLISKVHPEMGKYMREDTKQSGANLRKENELNSLELRKQWELESKEAVAAEKAKAASAAKSAQEQYNKSVDNWRANPTKQNEDKVRSDYDILRASWLSRISNNPDMSAYMETVGGIPKEPPVFNSKTQETQKAPTLPAGWTKK